MTEHKSEKLLALAKELGWEAEIAVDVSEYEKSEKYEDIVWTLYAKRGEETIKLPWRGNRMEQGLYVYGAHRKKLWWKAEVVKLLRGKPDPKKFYSKEQADGKEVQKKQFIPWDDDTPAFDIMLAVINRKVEYVRTIDGQICEVVVDVNLQEQASAKHFRVYSTKSGRRVLEWADALGFHAVGLDQIINVA